MTVAQIETAGVMSDPLEKGDRFDPETIHWCWDLSDLRTVAEAIEGCTEIVYDLETTGLNEHESGDNPEWPVAAKVVLAQFTLPRAAEPLDRRPTTYLVPLYHPESPLIGHWKEALTYLAEAMRRSGKPITGQNLKFDLRWTYAHTEVDLSVQYAWDTQTASHLLDETTTTSLKPRVEAVFGVPRWDDHDLSTPGAALRIPLLDLGLYGARDTYWTWRWAVAQRTILGVGEEGRYLDPPEDPQEVEERRLGKLATWCSIPSGSALTETEQYGVLLDKEWTRERLRATEESAAHEFESLINRYEGIDPTTASLAPTSKWFLEWAGRAVEAGDLRITATTQSGNPQWNKAVLTRQALAGSEVAQSLLRYRANVKQGEYLRSWLALATPESTVHTTYHIGRTVTGRLSSSDPNFQQITYALKPAFIPRPGFLIAECDYSQIELRIAAFISRCRPMLEAYRTGQDLHRITASNVAGVPLEDVTKDMRQLAKAVNFGLLYGMGADGLQTYAETVYGVAMSEEEAVDARAAFFRTYPELSTWHGSAVRRAQQTEQVVSPIGRVRRLPDIHDGNQFLRGQAERRAINAPVQGFASDLMQIACASIAGRVPGHDPVPQVRLLGTVHDSVVVEVPEDDWKRSTARVMHRMLGVTEVLEKMGCTLDVPLGVESTVSTRWGLGDIGVIA